MWDRHPYYREREPGPLADLGLLALAGVAVTLLLVWSAGELAGRLWHGAWPEVTPAGSPAELVQLWRHPSDPPAPGIPGGGTYFSALTALVLIAVGLAIALLRVVRPRKQRWVPPLPVSSSSHEPFVRVYRRGRASRPR